MHDHSTYTQTGIKDFFTFFSPSIRMSRKNVTFGNKKIRRTIWYKNSLKYFIGYNDNDVIRPLCIISSKSFKISITCKKYNLF